MSALIPVSAGFVHAIDLVSMCIVDQFGAETINEIEEGVAITLGGLSELNRFIFITCTIPRLLSGFFFCILVYLLLLLRSPGFNAIALSLIIGFPLSYLVAFWQPTTPLTIDVVFFFCRGLVVQLTIALTLLFFLVFLMRRLGKAVDVKIIVDANTSQRVLRLAVVVIYLSVSAYGWNDMRNLRAEIMIERAEWKETMEEFDRNENHKRRNKGVKTKGQTKGTQLIALRPKRKQA